MHKCPYSYFYIVSHLLKREQKQRNRLKKQKSIGIAAMNVGTLKGWERENWQTYSEGAE